MFFPNTAVRTSSRASNSAHILAYAHLRNDVIFLYTGLHTNYFRRQTGGGNTTNDY